MTVRLPALVLCLLAAAPAAIAQQAGDAARGQRVFNQQCRACHTLDAGGKSPVGPNLHGLFGRKAGTLAGVSFSDAMKGSDIVWDDATLAEYLRDPKGKVPGTTMTFVGLRQPAQIADIVAYLKDATK